MEIPNRVVPRTRPSSQPLAYLREADTSGIMQGVNRIASAFGSLAGQLQERTSQTQRFAGLSAFGEFEKQVAVDMAEFQRNSLPDDMKFVENWEIQFNKRKADFVKNLPSDQREEFNYRAEQVGKGLFGNALRYQYDKQDTYFRGEVGKVLNEARVAIDNNPEATDTWIGRIDEYIDSTALSATEKEERKLLARQALKTIKFGKEYVKLKGALVTGGFEGSAYSADGTLSQAYKDRLRQIESAGNDRAVSSTGAKGRYQLTRGTAKQYDVTDPFDVGQQEAFIERFTRDNFEYLQAKLGREPTAGELYLAHQQGAGGAVALLTAGNVSAASVVGKQAVLVNGGTERMSASQFASMWINKFEKGTPAAAKLDDDPYYAEVSYEDRLAARQDAVQQYKANLTATQAYENELHTDRLNTLLTDVLDGRAGQKEYDQAVQEGWLNDFEERVKVENALKRREEQVSDAEKGWATLGGPAALTIEDKHYNAAYRDTQERVLSMDPGYFKSVMQPMVERAQKFPTDYISTVTLMARSDDPKKFKYAMDALVNMEQVAPEAYRSQVDENVRGFADFYKDRIGLPGYDEARMMREYTGGSTTQERQLKQQLREEGEKKLTDKTVDFNFGRDVFTPLVAEWGSDAPMRSPEGIILQKEWQTIFLDEYARRGDFKEAREAATKLVGGQWKVTEVGGVKRLMKHAPELYVPKLSGGYEWIDRQIEQETNLAPNQTFRLFTDGQTQSDLKKKGVPSYLVYVTTLREGETTGSGGFYEDPNSPDPTKPIPYRYTPKPDQTALFVDDLDKQIAQKEAVFGKMVSQYSLSGETGGVDLQLQEELQANVDRAQKEIDSLKERRRLLRPAKDQSRILEESPFKVPARSGGPPKKSEADGSGFNDVLDYAQKKK